MNTTTSKRVAIGALRLCIAAGVALLLATSFRAGWASLNTDFPNYYTGATLVRQNKSIRDYYDWTWFARQMNYAGVESQLGAYTPQTPLTMLPMVALTGLPPLEAKRVWLAMDLVFLALTVILLARVFAIRWESITVLLLLGHGSLTANFLDGQYYIFLLFLVAVTLCLFERRYFAGSGFISGAAFALKLYTGPLLLFFVVKKKWMAAAGMLAGTALLGLLAIALFGWSANLYYLTHVLPRTLDAGAIDPYNPGDPTIYTLLRRLFLREPTLNPHPAIEAPWLCFFLSAAAKLGLIAFATLGAALAKATDYRRDFALFLLALLLMSTNLSSYTFILLLLPVVSMQGVSRLRLLCIGISYILLTNNIGMAWLFPKVWLLLSLLVLCGLERWRSIRPRLAIGVALAALILPAGYASWRMRGYGEEPGRRYPQIAVEAGAMFSDYPAVTSFGLFYQGMGDPRKNEEGYLLRWEHDGRIDRLSYGGYALLPFARTPSGPICFELVAHQRSRTMCFDPSTGRTAEAPGPIDAPDRNAPKASPDGRWIAYTRETLTSQQIWIEDVATGMRRMLAGGACDNSSPAWELDSSAVIFASDCGRAFGLPALYRAPVGR